MTEPIASSKCLVCGKDTPHVHNLTEQGQYTKIQRLNSQIRELQRENESLQAELAQLRKELAEAKKHIHRLDEYAKEIDNSRKEVTVERDRLAAIVKEAGEQLVICYMRPSYEPEYSDTFKENWIALFANPPIREGYVMVHVSVLENATSSLGAFCSDEGWGQDDMDNMDAVDAELAKYYARLSASTGRSNEDERTPNTSRY